ncbi:glycosyltransferase N-terminal domain-containing protein [uncultured Aliiroseovarius sp.]|uniref:3-deoxy-D-manno-octulosonic acid transferase n=1 Tax=uncultured Aliiroseovarius sp. TaxID=1658783 RepID=UPI00261D39D5|nr:glycosyltransferase N-terminal domain-containing protein [uncultured Aliiroseovarius sp.]
MSPFGISLFRGLHTLQGAAGLERRLKRRIADGREHPDRGTERLGIASAERPDGPLVWLHLTGGDEIEKVSALIQHLKASREDLNVLITTTLYDAEFPDDTGAIHQFSPYSGVGPINAFLDHWAPDVALWVDSQLDVPLLSELFKRKVPAIWINAHLPRETHGQWRWLPGLMKSVLTGFDTILAENLKAEREIRRLGAASSHVTMSGPLQMQVVPPGCNMAERDRFAAKLAARPVWLAAATHEKEVAQILAAHRQLIRKSHRLLLIIEPGVPEDGPRLAEDLEADGWSVACRSRDEDPSPDVQVFVADQAGETGLWMHLAPITFIGGSLADEACLNPLEPAALGSVVLFGPLKNGHNEAFRRLETAGAASMVKDQKTLTQAVERLLSPDCAAKMAMAAWDITTSGAEVSDLVRDRVVALLDQAGV